MKQLIVTIAAAFLLQLNACGDPLADGAWRGVPLFTIHGWVHLALTPEEYAALDYLRDGELRTAIFWAPTRGSSYSLATAVEQDVNTVGSFPAQFELTVHQPPPDELLRADERSGEAFAVGLVVAYRDLDGNGRWDRNSERLVGGANGRFVLYAPDGLNSLAFGALAPGFHRVVPTDACASGAETVTYATDPADEIALVVGRGFPAEVAFRLDCSGTTIEWQGACPPLHLVRQTCSDTSGTPTTSTDPMCEACRGLLAPILNDRTACNQWLETCLLRFPSEECQREAYLCTGTAAPTTPPPNECDNSCMCQREYENCLDLNPPEREGCRIRLERCLNPTSR